VYEKEVWMWCRLYEKALQYDPGTHIVSSGALATLSGAKTGRSPK
jgi:phosphoenolpyruvate carboxykinase (ATP)